jgi:hypothetical protein
MDVTKPPWQNHHNRKDNLENLNNLVQDMCVSLQNISFGNKLRTVRPGHRSFYTLFSMTALFKLVSAILNRLSVIFPMDCHRVPFCLQLYIIISLRIALTVEGCELATFANDIFVSSKDPTVVCDGLQEQFDSLTDYFEQWKIRVNATKTQAVYFTRWLNTWG